MSFYTPVKLLLDETENLVIPTQNKKAAVGFLVQAAAILWIEEEGKAAKKEDLVELLYLDFDYRMDLFLKEQKDG